MRDKISIDRIDKLHPKVRAEAKLILEKAEAELPNYLAIRVVQGLRTFKEQQDIYNQGRVTPGKIVSNAKPGSSLHNYGLALDFAILYDKDKNGTYETISWDTIKDEDKDGVRDWNEIANSFKLNGWLWGGDFKSITDMPHVEKTFGYSWRVLLEKKNSGKIDRQGYIIL